MIPTRFFSCFYILWIVSRSLISCFAFLIMALLFCFCRRKWLPPPLRKLSQGKVDKAAQSSAPPSSSPAPPPLKKTGSDKRIKVREHCLPLVSVYSTIQTIQIYKLQFIYIIIKYFIDMPTNYHNHLTFIWNTVIP